MGGTPAKCWWSSTKAATSLTAPSPGSTPLRTDSSPPELPRPLGLLRASGSCSNSTRVCRKPNCLRSVAGWWVVQAGGAILVDERPLLRWYWLRNFHTRSGWCQRIILSSPDVHRQGATHKSAT